MQRSARAVFLDRDGVLNRNVFYTDTGAWESPRSADAVELNPGAAEALRWLRAAGYLLIVVSNQPNAAKGKCSELELHAVHAQLNALLAAEQVVLDAHYLCLHHPQFTGPCLCRKPSPFFLLQAAERFAIDLRRSWMIGDRETDIACGRAAGTRTIWIDNGEGVTPPAAEAAPDWIATGFREAVERLLSWELSPDSQSI